MRLKFLKYKENNKKMYDTFDHNFKNIPSYTMSYVLIIERHYVLLYDHVLQILENGA